MSCPGGNYVVPGADPCGSGGGAIESINGLVGALTVTSADDSLTVTNAGTNIDLSVAGGGPLVLHFSGQTDANGTYTNQLGPEEGYIMLDKNYAVTVTQSTLTTNPISIVITKTNLSVIINTYQNSTTPEPSIQFDAILVATNYQKVTLTPAFLEFPLAVVADFTTDGGGNPISFGFLPTGTNITTPGGPQYISPLFNTTVTLTLTIAGQMDSSTSFPINYLPNNRLAFGVYGPGVDNLVAGFAMSGVGTVPIPIDNGIGIPTTVPSPNYVATVVTIPYAGAGDLATANSLFFGLFLAFPTSGPLLSVRNLQMVARIDYIAVT
jgi:hypothetical protein